MSSDSLRRLRLRLLLVIFVLLLFFFGWNWWERRRTPSPAALEANNRGIGLMEQYRYPEAADAFAEVVKQTPDWRPGQINHAIALMNMHTPDSLAQARAAFMEVLKREPNNPHGHFCLGIILRYQVQEQDQARDHFEAVTRIDPQDAAAWYWLGTMLPAGTDQAIACFEKALKIDPHLSGALYDLAGSLRERDRPRFEALLNEHKKLSEGEWENAADYKYGQMGRYSEVIGRVAQPPGKMPIGPLPLFTRSETFVVELQPGVRWATAADLRRAPNGELLVQIRSRFGASLVVLDFNRDGKPDLFLAAAVVEGGKVRDLLLRNDGACHFTEVSKAAGLNPDWSSVGCCVGDFDNDGFLDLFLTGAKGGRLLRNTGQGAFEDVTGPAGLSEIGNLCLTATFIDLDQDGDLDLVLAQFASPEQAGATLRGEAAAPGPGLAVYLNIGEAPPSPSKKPLPLKPRFRRLEEPPALIAKGMSVVGIAVADCDNDQDLDLVVLAERQAPRLILNDRFLRFHQTILPETLAPPAAWNGALVVDVNNDERSDLFLIGMDQKPLLLLGGLAADSTKFERSPVDSPPLKQAQAIDLDLDGWTDVVALSAAGLPVLLHNEGGRLAHAPQALGSDAAWPKDLVGVAVTDVDGDGYPDLLVWSETAGLQLQRSQGNGNAGLKLELAGQRRQQNINKLRCNAEGFGTRVIAQAGNVTTSLENTTLSAGLGQSYQPLVLGLGRNRQAQVVRLRWPDNTWQAEMDVPAGKLTTIEETNRRSGSCPLLFAWNGRNFGFVTDFLGAGSLGEGQADGGCRLPRAEESIKIEAEQLALRDGAYFLKLAEPMDEVTYLDRLQLLVVDHPADVLVYPDERFVAEGPPASQDLLLLRGPIWPSSARDHRGKDVTATLRHRDRDTVSNFAWRSWLGLSEEHGVELDFGDRLSRFGPKDRIYLCLAGWTDYPYPESLWAAGQAGVAATGPVLEKLGPDGRWQPLMDIGFPAGLPRMMTVEVTGKLTGPSCVLRLRTNLDVYWDQIFVAPAQEVVPSAVASSSKSLRLQGRLDITSLNVASAELSSRGFMAEVTPDGRPPLLYDYDRLEAVLTTKLTGKLTKFGSVTELLHEVDDRFVIFGPGDEISIRFDAGNLPALPAGWKRDFVLRTWGYCKDCGPFTKTSGAIEPLPFHDMKSYPYGPGEHYPDDEVYRAYRQRFNTRF